MTTPTITADKAVLTRLLALGASFFPVQVMLDDNGKCSKIPKVREWQKTVSFDIDREELLNGAAAYGFHPETIGAYVIDLDRKGGKDGEDELVKELGPIDAITHPEVYVDTPNGRHVYFSILGLPAGILVGRNNVLPGVDIRGHHSGGWLVCPGSVGYSSTRGDWARYELEGEIENLPKMPEALVQLLVRLLQKNDVSERLPDFLEPAKKEELIEPILDDHSMRLLFDRAVNATKVPSQFNTLVNAFVPGAVRSGTDWVTGDYEGNPGGSCHFTPMTGLVKDFNDAGKGGDFLWYLSDKKGMGNVKAAVAILETLGQTNPIARNITPQSVKAEATVLAQASTAPVTGNYPQTDSGNAERLVAMAGGTLRYNSSAGLWMAWDGQVWVRDEAESFALSLAKRVARSIAQEVLDHPSGDTREDQKKTMHAKRSESSTARKAMVSMASVEPGVAVEEEGMDPSPDLINTKSGIVELKTGAVLAHDPEELMTQICESEVSFDPCPRFALFLAEIMEFDEGLIEWMQQYLGYCLTGRTSDQVFPIWWGGGQNGKSVLLHIVGKLMGSYCKKASAESWLTKVNGQPVRDDIAALRGARFVWASEPEANRVLAVSMVKELTGGDPVTCRHLYGRQFTYTPTFKTAFVTNHKPRVQSQDFGIWRRLRFVPFCYRVPDDKRIPDLGDLLLKEEGPAILGWMVAGAIKWYEAGKLPPCDKIHNATADLKEGDDVLSEFLMEKCTVNQALSTKFDFVWMQFREWNEEKGIKVYAGRTTFRSLISEKACFLMRKSVGAWYVDGIGLKAQLT